MKYLNKITMLFAALAVMTVGVSCTADTTDASANDRLFRPVNVSVAQELTETGVDITATWAGIEGSISYVVELYQRDVLTVTGEDNKEVKYNNMQLVARDENVQDTRWTIRDLPYSTQFYFRVKGNHANPAQNSYFSDYYSVKTLAETQVLSVKVDDVRKGNVTFTWMEGYDLEFIDITKPDGDVFTRYIDDADLQASILGLERGEYSAVAGNDRRTFNVVTFLIPVLFNVELSDITFDGVQLYWMPDYTIKKLSLVNTADSSDTYEFDVDGNAGEFKIDSDKIGYSSTYKAVLVYEDGETTNSVTFTTMDQAPENLTIVSDYASLDAALAAASDGAVIALNPGLYDICKPNDAGGMSYQNMAITTGVTLRPATAEMPVVKLKNLQIKNPMPVELIRLEGIEFVGYDEDNDTSVDSYLFDLTTDAQASVERIEIEHCVIHGIGNSLVRADRKADINVMEIYINDNLMWDMTGKQCWVATYYDKGIATRSLTFTNNTITGLSKKATNQRAFSYMASENYKLTINNNTFYECHNGTNPFIHARGSVDGSWGKVEIQKNIFYNEVDGTDSWPVFDDSDNNTLATLAISGNLMNLAWSKSTSSGIQTNDWTQYDTMVGGPNFKNASKLDFTVTNTTVLKRKMGDPRWLVED